MNKSSKAFLYTMALLLTPCVALTLFYLYLVNSSNILPVFVVLHVFTALWVVLFYRKRLGRVSLMPVSFLIALAGPYLYDTLFTRSSWMLSQYIGTAMVSAFYALPWAAITLVAAVVIIIRQRRRTVNRNVF